MRDLDYLKLLSERFPSRRKCLSEIINLNAILELPKGTEYFFSDIHGEDQAFIHLLRSSSGVIRDKINDIFKDELCEDELRELAHVIYYPKRELEEKKLFLSERHRWQKKLIYRLIRVCRSVSKKYTRSKVRKKMPADYAYILDEMLHTDEHEQDKQEYFESIIDTIVEHEAADSFIVELCDLIHNLSIDSLHILGDIFDRGPRADLVMEELMHYADVDIVWGNHDINWMGAACGNEACICNVLRVGIGYNSFDVLEDGYGINLRALSMFAEEIYKDDPCTCFMPHLLDENLYDTVTPELAAKMQKAITIMQLKLEGALIKRHPEYGMEDRLLLDKIDPEYEHVVIGGKCHELKDHNFPTIDISDPYRLTEGEQRLMDTLRASFMHSKLLRKHIGFLYAHGSLYRCCNGNLLYHGCIPMQEDGSFMSASFNNMKLSGKSLLDFLNGRIRDAYYLSDKDENKQDAVDLLWYLWCGRFSPLFGKDKMATFESIFLGDAELKKERMNAYYILSKDVATVDRILREFGLSTTHGHIVNGHVPVKRLEGELPYRAEGKLFMIDGGLSKAYQKKTGIAGYTLIYNSQSIALAEHMPFVPGEESTPKVEIMEHMSPRVRVRDTDIGLRLQEQIKDLKELLKAYREGRIEETQY